MQPIAPSNRRILTIDDNDAIHGDFRKVLVATKTPASLSTSKAALFGDAPPPKAVPALFEVDSALQGAEGLQKLQKALQEARPYSVAFVDMRMPPGWDGLQTIQRLWEVDPDLQVVICTAYSDHSWEEIFNTLGLTDRLLILKKPFDPAEVLQLASALSEKWSLRRAAKLKMEELEQMVQKRTGELAHVAMHDKLTGLPNRALVIDRLQKTIAMAQADESCKYALLFLDFDRFKLINDSLGHEAGDGVLKGIAERLRTAMKLAGAAIGEAVAARLGGDEFVILMEKLANVDDAVIFADGLLRILSAPYPVVSREVQSTASIGITSSALRYTRAEDALRDADTAMYRAKAAGKARYVIFDKAMHEEATMRLEMENDLRTAVDRDELVLHYQPIISLVDGAIFGFEALVRWKHPKRGLVPPCDFVPCCEESGAIVPIGNWILHRACRQLMHWQTRHAQLSDMTISVNVSARQVSSAFVDEIEKALSASNIRPSSLILEITESVLIDDPKNVGVLLNKIRSLGVGLHIDDFGTGYSALSILHQFPLDGLKIDRRFMQNVSERRDYAAVVNSIVSLARNLGMKLIAEGIENADQVALLQGMDCDLAQGYFFDCPRDVAGAQAFIERQLARKAAA